MFELPAGRTAARGDNALPCVPLAELIRPATHEARVRFLPSITAGPDGVGKSFSHEPVVAFLGHTGDDKLSGFWLRRGGAFGLSLAVSGLDKGAGAKPTWTFPGFQGLVLGGGEISPTDHFIPRQPAKTGPGAAGGSAVGLGLTRAGRSGVLVHCWHNRIVRDLPVVAQAAQF
jgi:hypothetical protein